MFFNIASRKTSFIFFFLYPPLYCYIFSIFAIFLSIPWKPWRQFVSMNSLIFFLCFIKQIWSYPIFYSSNQVLCLGYYSHLGSSLALKVDDYNVDGDPFFTVNLGVSFSCFLLMLCMFMLLMLLRSCGTQPLTGVINGGGIRGLGLI